MWVYLTKWTIELWIIFCVVLRQSLSIKDMFDAGTSLKRTLSAGPNVVCCREVPLSIVKERSNQVVLVYTHTYTYMWMYTLNP